jgi:hypothetical protein
MNARGLRIAIYGLFAGAGFLATSWWFARSQPPAPTEISATLRSATARPPVDREKKDSGRAPDATENSAIPPSEARSTLPVRLRDLGEALLQAPRTKFRKRPAGETMRLEIPGSGETDFWIQEARRSIEQRSPGSWDGLRRAVLEDPQTYVAFLRDPAHGPIVLGLLDLLLREFDAPQATPDGLPAGVLASQQETALLLEMLSRGTRWEKLAVLRECPTGFRHELPASFQDSFLEGCSLLLSDSDPEVRGVAFYTFTQQARPALLEARADQAREAWLSIKDRLTPRDYDLRLALLDSLSAPLIREAPKVHELLLEVVRESFAKGDQIAYVQAAEYLGRIASREGQENHLDASMSLLASSFSESQDRECQRGLLEASVQFPLASCRAILEHARLSSRVPEIQRSADLVLNEIRGGETRASVFRQILDDTIGPSIYSQSGKHD